MAFSAPPPTSDSSNDLADWLELKALAERTRRLSRSRAKRELRDALSVDGTELESLVDLAFSEMNRRLDIAGGGYPFVRDHSGFTLRPDLSRAHYAFLLFVATSPAYRELKEQNGVAVLFEEVLTQAISEYLGGHGRAVRFGTPASGDRPAQWEEALRWLARKLNVSRGPAMKGPKKQDSGLDVVGWVEFADSRAAQLVLLAQATIEVNWWASDKHKDLDQIAWLGWLDTGRPAALALGIPFSIPASFAHWDELCRHTNVVMDRIRLSRVLAEAPDHDPAAAWTEEEAQRLIA